MPLWIIEFSSSPVLRIQFGHNQPNQFWQQSSTNNSTINTGGGAMKLYQFRNAFEKHSPSLFWKFSVSIMMPPHGTRVAASTVWSLGYHAQFQQPDWARSPTAWGTRLHHQSGVGKIRRGEEKHHKVSRGETFNQSGSSDAPGPRHGSQEPKQANLSSQPIMDQI